MLVALPFLREPEPVSDELDELTPERRRRLALAEERDRALAALKELEADHRAGRVNDEDYRASIGPLRREAAEALRALDAERGEGLASLGRESALMARRTALVAALATTLLLAGAAAGDPGSDKARVDARIGDLKAQAEQAAGTRGRADDAS